MASRHSVKTKSRVDKRNPAYERYKTKSRVDKRNPAYEDGKGMLRRA